MAIKEHYKVPGWLVLLLCFTAIVVMFHFHFVLGVLAAIITYHHLLVTES